MSYVPPNRKIPMKWILVVILVICIFLGAGLGCFYIKNNQTPRLEHFTICGLSEEKTAEALHEETSEETYTIRDYQFYGESLNLYAEDFTLGGKDDVRRKSIDLVNLCTDESLTYTMEDNADRRIDLAELEPGFYALTINDHLVKKRLIYEGTFVSEPFTTVKRDGKVKKVTLIADPAIVEPQLTQNYLFLQIEETQPQNEYDIFIDPYGAHLSNGAYTPASSGNGLDEAKEMQAAAEYLKEKLESYGLRVALSKNKYDDVLSYYGSDGIMDRAYQSNAKYYLELGMNVSAQSAYAGTEIYHSNYSSATLANSLMYALRKNTSLKASNAYTWTDRNEGVTSCNLTEGSDGQKLYDILPSIRESGGRVTGAATFSETAKGNASFAKDTRSGMQALSINFIYLSNPEDAEVWKKEKDAILTELADAFVKAIHVSEEAS